MPRIDSQTGIWRAPIEEAIDLAHVQAPAIGQFGRTEQLRLLRTDGGETRVTFVDRNDDRPLILTRIIAKGERDLLTEMIEANPYGLRFSRPALGTPLAFWEGDKGRLGRPWRVVQNLKDTVYRWGGAKATLPIQSEHEIDLPPTSVTVTPAGRVLWFGFSEPGFRDEARLTVMLNDGTVLAEVDLLELFGYRSAIEARKSLSFHEVQILRDEPLVGTLGDGRQVEIRSLGPRSPDTAERVEFHNAFKRAIVTIDGVGAKIELEPTKGAERQ